VTICTIKRFNGSSEAWIMSGTQQIVYSHQIDVTAQEKSSKPKAPQLTVRQALEKEKEKT
jgi:hypothetical protein